MRWWKDVEWARGGSKQARNGSAVGEHCGMRGRVSREDDKVEDMVSTEGQMDEYEGYASYWDLAIPQEISVVEDDGIEILRVFENQWMMDAYKGGKLREGTSDQIDKDG
jgi:hypothetical protein